MVIVLCVLWKCHKYVGGERVLGFRVETRIIYEFLFLGSHNLVQLQDERQGPVGSKEVFK